VSGIMLGVRVRTWLWSLALVGALGAGAVGVLSRNHVGAADPVEPVKSNEAINFAKGLSQAFREAANSALPSVVMIQTRPKAERPSARSPQPFNDEEDSPLGQLPPEIRRFFRDMPRGMGPDMDQRSGLGSGVIVDASGVILTNNHVVAGGGTVIVRLHDGRECEATEVKGDPKADLAIIRIKADKLKAAKLADSDKTAVGDWVLALGGPFGLEKSVTAGIISAKGRSLIDMQRGELLQTDAAINPGNSGGPLVNLDGEVVGINTAIYSRTGGYMGVGFAVPANVAKWIVGQLSSTGVVKRAYLGVIIQQVTHDLAESSGVKAREGVLIAKVQEQSPAAKAGVREGDVLLKFNGKPISSPGELQGLVEQCKIGDAQKVELLRDGKRMTVDVTALELPEEGRIARSGPRGPAGRPAGSRFEELGMDVAPLTGEVAEQLGVKNTEGVVISRVVPNSPANQAGLQSGLIVTQANRKPVKSVDDFRKAVQSQPFEKGLLLLVSDGEDSRYVVVKARN
jgi:serine protease Do